MPNPIDHLIFHARTRPEDAAIRLVNGPMKFRQLLASVRGVAGLLREAGVRPGMVVMTSIPVTLWDWVISLALMHEGVVSCSRGDTNEMNPALGIDFLVYSGKPPAFAPERSLQVDSAWMKNASRGSPEITPHAFDSDDTLLRLVLTSGSTGTSKAVEFTVKQCYQQALVWQYSMRHIDSMLTLLGLSTTGGYFTLMINMVNGTPAHVAHSFEEIIALFNTYRIELLAGSPAQLAGLLAKLRKDSVRLSSLRQVLYGGASAYPGLLKAMHAILCPNIQCAYGSTELGFTAAHFPQPANLDARAAGYLLPNVELQVVDEMHQPLGFNQEGLIRLKAPHMAHAYYRDPERNAERFRDGWFYPGDRGELCEDGMLLLGGRDDLVINIGGVKVSPEVVEEAILELDEIRDCAVFAVNTAAGSTVLCGALVVPEDFKVEALNAHLKEKLNPARRPAIFLKVEQIPRNPMGKILRPAVLENFGAMVRERINQRRSES